MPEPLDVVTGAFSYTGRHIAIRLLAAGRRVRTLTGHPNRPDPLREQVEVRPYRFDEPDELARSLEGASTLYNTYWVRFVHGSASFDQAVRNSETLFRAARRAGVTRVVHVSITNPSSTSPLPYFRGKAMVEHALAASGLAYGIVRPTVVFGPGDVLVNNIAWLLRRFPAFPVAGTGEYRVRPVHVEDVARLCVETGGLDHDRVVDAVGPEDHLFVDMVRLIRAAVGSNATIVHVPAAGLLLLSRLIGALVDDVVLTREELEGLTAELVTTPGPPTGQVRLSEWVRRHGDELGRRYASELGRHYRA